MVVGMTVAVGVPTVLAAMVRMLAVARWVSVPGVLVLRTGCTGADWRCCADAGDDKGRIFAVRTAGPLSVELLLKHKMVT